MLLEIQWPRLNQQSQHIRYTTETLYNTYVVYVKGNFVVVSERRDAQVFAGYAR